MRLFIYQRCFNKTVNVFFGASRKIQFASCRLVLQTRQGVFKLLLFLFAQYAVK